MDVGVGPGSGVGVGMVVGVGVGVGAVAGAVVEVGVEVGVGESPAQDTAIIASRPSITRMDAVPRYCFKEFSLCETDPSLCSR